jgi:CO dehydrogenase maturation factor
MEAGLEHLSRSGCTLAYADILLVVMEPTSKSVITASRTVALAAELGLSAVYVVGNKARTPEDVEFFRTICDAEGLILAGIVPYDADVVAAERAGTVLGPDDAGAARRAVADVVALIDSPAAQRDALSRTRDRLARRLAELGEEIAV